MQFFSASGKHEARLRQGRTTALDQAAHTHGDGHQNPWAVRQVLGASDTSGIEGGPPLSAKAKPVGNVDEGLGRLPPGSSNTKERPAETGASPLLLSCRVVGRCA